MESILARALEYTLKYWLKSFSRDQFKLQGRTAQLSNLDINGDALHASVGLPPALNVVTAKVGKLEITLPSVSCVQTDPIVVHIDRLDLVLVETVDSDDGLKNSGSAQSASSSAKGGGYGFADKIADGMTLQVGTVNLLLETHGGARRQGGATWASPMASVTIRNLLLYTTNEHWQVVNLKEARNFSNEKKCIYVFKKLEWQSLSIDLLPHPDMFSDARLTIPENKENTRDDDGAKRLFFGGERFLEGISAEAYITVQRTEQNSPLGLEVQLHITEAICPSLSEPGLRALLRFMTGLYVCLNRGDVDPVSRQNGTEVAGHSIVSISVDHIFLCVKDAEFQLELLMQSLFFSRASLSDGKNTKTLTRVMVGGLFLRDTHSHPLYTLIQPSVHDAVEEFLDVPEIGENFCPAIYPLGDHLWRVDMHKPLIRLNSLQINPSPRPPSFASQTVIECQPLLINLHEESCLRISSFLADGIVANPGVVLPDFSINSFIFTLRGFILTVPLDSGVPSDFTGNENYPFGTSFSGARLQMKDVFFSQSPSVPCKLLNLDKDPVCFAFWPGQPIDASQKKWMVQASYFSLSLETYDQLGKQGSHPDISLGLWTCIELHEPCFEAAMVTADGTPLINLPPPEGIVRIGISCKQCVSNSSVEQLFFVLYIYSYFDKVSDKIAKIIEGHRQNRGESHGKRLMEKVPSDTAVSLAIRHLQIRFLESSLNGQEMPLVQFGGEDLFIKVTHQILGGAFVVSTNITCNSVQIDCVDTEKLSAHENGIVTEGDHELLGNSNGYQQMRAVFWINTEKKNLVNPLPFLAVSMRHVMPYNIQDMECHSLNVSSKICGVRLGGGMNYTEALLHRVGVLGTDGGPGEGLSKGIKKLSSGPLANIFRSLPPIGVNQENGGCPRNEISARHLELGRPDDVDVCIELKDWLFALEGARDVGEEWVHYSGYGTRREENCWHTTFTNLQVKARRSPENARGSEKLHKKHDYPVELVKVSVEGLQALKPRARNDNLRSDVSLREDNQASKNIKDMSKIDGRNGGINLETSLVVSENVEDGDMASWAVENIKFAVKEPIEAVATKEELEQLVFLCKSEVDSMGRIAAGILRIFKLEESFGKSTIDQLSNLGSEGLDRIFAPEKPSSRSSIGSPGFSNLNFSSESPRHSLEPTISSLESVLSDSQAKCSALVVELNSPEVSGQHLAHIKQLNQKLESLQVLLMRLRTQV